jgi:hypothetical protein
MKLTCLLLVVTICLTSYSVGAPCPDSKPGAVALAVKDNLDTSDSVSSRWLFQLWEAIAKSPRYCLVGRSGDAYVTLSVSLIDTDPKNILGDRAAVSMAAYFTSSTVFINHWLYLCGAGTVDHCAETALADFDHALHSVPPEVKPKEPSSKPD